jgi:hypothetical protein
LKYLHFTRLIVNRDLLEVATIAIDKPLTYKTPALNPKQLALWNVRSLKHLRN